MHPSLGIVLIFIAGSASAYNITYTVENQLEGNLFTHTMQLETNSNRTFYNSMLEAQEEDENFTFTSRDYGGVLGHFITSVDGLENDIPGEKFWGFLLRRPGQGDCKLPVGVSNYVPVENDHVVLSYITFTILRELNQC